MKIYFASCAQVVVRTRRFDVLSKEQTPSSSLRARQQLSQNDFLLLGFVCFPYNTFSDFYSAIVLVLLSCLSVLLGKERFDWRQNLTFTFFGLSASAYILVSFAWPIFPREVIFSQSNHIVQYLVYVIGIVSVAHNLDRFLEVLSRKSVKLTLLLSVVITYTISVLNIGYVHEFAPNSIALVIACLYAAGKDQSNFIFSTFALSMVLAAVLSSGRISTLLVFAAFILLRVLALPSILARFCAFIILVAPLIFYSAISRDILFDLLAIDHNAYIRAEFIRAAFQGLFDNLALGVGFGPDYRPHNYAYVTTHKLLTDAQSLATVSNHHSIFDTAYRLGLPITLLLVHALFIKPSTKDHSRMLHTIIIILALGMSLNAWFEAQTQVTIVAFLSALLLCSRVGSQRR